MPFNMPFELGLAVAHAKNARGAHQWFVFETKRNRIKKSLSDVDGTDPHIHGGKPRRVLVELSNALVHKRGTPTIDLLFKIYADLQKRANLLKSDYGGGSLFAARPFKDLVIAATDLAERNDQ